LALPTLAVPLEITAGGSVSVVNVASWVLAGPPALDACTLKW